MVANSANIVLAPNPNNKKIAAGTPKIRSSGANPLAGERVCTVPGAPLTPRGAQPAIRRGRS